MKMLKAFLMSLLIFNLSCSDPIPESKVEILQVYGEAIKYKEMHIQTYLYQMVCQMRNFGGGDANVVDYQFQLSPYAGTGAGGTVTKDSWKGGGKTFWQGFDPSIYPLRYGNWVKLILSKKNTGFHFHQPYPSQISVTLWIEENNGAHYTVTATGVFKYHIPY